ncbi:MAG: type II toxin-antitoxin system VapC family toxin [Acidobacteria bacterium]|nr:type II toxin-antitoxin system VapC family toxin [Acidobacteriota bacterium]
MSSQLLPSLGHGSNIFIDADVLVHGLSGYSVQCAQFLERCSREEVTGVTLFEILNEATHKFMLAEAMARGYVASTRRVDQLRARCVATNVIATLTHYWQQTERILSMNLLFLSTEESIVRTAQSERSSACLLTNDSMIVSCMRQLGIVFIATVDRDFERASGVTVFRPDDV